MFSERPCRALSAGGRKPPAWQEDAEDFSPMGRLSVRLYLARDLPAERPGRVGLLGHPD